MAHIKQERDAHSATSMEAPVYPWSGSPDEPLPSDSFGASMPQLTVEANANGRHGRAISADFGSGGMASRLIRRNTRVSESTNQTTGSFARILEGYSEPYVQTVKRLVKRFTAPINQRRFSISPISETVPPTPSWVNDNDAPSVFVHNRPFPLPGDFLRLDVLLSQQTCFVASEDHVKRRCVCFASNDIRANSPWVTPEGVNALAQQAIDHGPMVEQMRMKDAFGNTILHFFAARGQLRRLGATLLAAVQSGQETPAIGDVNSAGQTFLHVVDLRSLTDLNLTCQLLDTMLHTRQIDIHAQDIYGRTFFHILRSAEVFNHNELHFLLQRYASPVLELRDAFNMIPVQQQSFEPDSFERRSTQAMDLGIPTSNLGYLAVQDHQNSSTIEREARFIELARLASTDPSLEDKEGRNGLHCLALASLSTKSLIAKASMSTRPSPERQSRRDMSPEDLLDSSRQKLEFRLSEVTALLEAGVNVNHYDIYGNTPLMAFAAELPEDDDYRTGPAIIQALVANGARLHARNRAGETALHIAVRCGRKLAARELLRLGANVHVRDADGRSILTVADVKVQSCREDVPSEYAHYEACRAYLSGEPGSAVQEPTILQEWGQS
jgi:hypothetical protein